MLINQTTSRQNKNKLMGRPSFWPPLPPAPSPLLTDPLLSFPPPSPRNNTRLIYKTASTVSSFKAFQESFFFNSWGGCGGGGGGREGCKIKICPSNEMNNKNDNLKFARMTKAVKALEKNTYLILRHSEGGWLKQPHICMLQ